MKHAALGFSHVISAALSMYGNRKEGFEDVSLDPLDPENLKPTLIR